MRVWRLYALGRFRGRDFVFPAQGEKSVAARRAAVSRHVQQAWNPGKPPGHMLVGDSLQIEVAALVAVGFYRKLQWNSLGKKTVLAFRASPRT